MSPFPPGLSESPAQQVTRADGELTELSQWGGCRVSRQQCGLWGQADLNLSYSAATPWWCGLGQGSPLASASSSVDGIVIAPSLLVV